MTNHIGRYEIRGELGHGGMATVYRAYDPSFGREVAVKVLPAELLHDPSFRSRFEREARTVAGLEHPAIVPVHDVGEHEGQPYLVMRLMTGTLEERLRSGPLTLTEAATLFARLAGALDQAHRQGIIHRDLKPGNILFDSYGTPYISDFGIVKLREASQKISKSGSVVGTPAYMSPEQAHGDGDLDGRSDVYTLGVILFEVLTGKTPYQAKTPVEMMKKHVLEPVPRILDLNPTLPPGIEAIIARAMAKKPEERYATAGELAAGLTALAEEISAAGVPETVVAPAPTVATAATEIITPPAMTPQTPPVAQPAASLPPAPQTKQDRTPLFWIGGVLGMLLLLYLASLGISALLGSGDASEAAVATPSPQVQAPSAPEEIALSAEEEEEAPAEPEATEEAEEIEESEESEEAEEDFVDLTDAIDIQDSPEISSFHVAMVMRMEGEAFEGDPDVPSNHLSFDGDIVKNPPAERMTVAMNTGDPRLDHIEVIRADGKNYMNIEGQWHEVPAENVPDVRAVLFIKPENLREMEPLVELIGPEVVNGRDTIHYQGDGEALALLDAESSLGTEVVEDALLDVWLDAETGFVVKLTVEATGSGINEEKPEAQGSISVRLEYSKFNEPFSIRAPQ